MITCDKIVAKPCNVCGATELNLVAGYYYCVECGTQDVETVETIIEQKEEHIGIGLPFVKRKFTTTITDGNTMSGEWFKWHAYNFILVGLTEELIAVGANPSVKNKILWIWKRYIKKFQVEEELEISTSKFQHDTRIDNEELNKDVYVEGDISEDDNSNENKFKNEKFRKDIKVVTKATLLTILYIGLNLDYSDIQLSHLFRFINEERLSIYNCVKFLPKELDTKSIPYWRNFMKSNSKLSTRFVRELAVTFFKSLDLGVPIVPNLTKIIDNNLLELCLPLDIRDLVLSLLHKVPCDFLQIDFNSKRPQVRLPDYEVVCVSYILLSMKICFGLDDDYEIRLSKAVDDINNSKNYLKTYRLGFEPEPSNRLFSFYDWCKYLQFRRVLLSKHYLYYSQLYNLPIDDYVLLEQFNNRGKQPVRLSDDITMNIINKIPDNNIPRIIPKKEFLPSLTPLTTYTDIVSEYVNDPDVKLLLCEDFLHYSLKYATQDLTLPFDENIQFSFTGVDKSNKIFNNHIIGCLENKKSNTTMVFVRNCENHNWLKTKPPTIKHITIGANELSTMEECDSDYNSNIENTESKSLENISVKITNKNFQELDEYDIIEEENEGTNIFDDILETCDIDICDNDDFYSIKEEKEKFDEINFENDRLNYSSSTSEFVDHIDRNIDRKGIIDELIQIACNKYKITLPVEKNEVVSKKRKHVIANDEINPIAPKKKKLINKTESKYVVNEMISVYYKTLENDLLNKISDHVKTLLQNVCNTTENNNTLLNSTREYESNFSNENCGVLSNANNILSTADLSVEENQGQSEAEESVIDNSLSHFDDNDTTNNENDIFPKLDPNYDPKTHDINQLYVKLQGNFKIEDYFDINDLNLETIIDKKIEEFSNGKNADLTSSVNKNRNLSESSDDVPLNILKQKKLCNKNIKLTNFLNAPTKVKEFGYWLRHYESDKITKKEDLGKTFDFELGETCPKSFLFVINECATILGCKKFSLYKCLQKLEKKLITSRRRI